MQGLFSLHIFENNLKSIDRLDLVWDIYKPDSLKEMTREKRGKGVRRIVSSTTKFPANWNDFLRMGENKKELFSYLAQEICKINSDKLVISTIDESALCNQAIDLSGQLSPCNHEEADTRIFVHAKDIYQKGMKKIMIRTVDTDVVVLAVYAMNELIFDEMWIHFGVGKKSRFIPVHEIHRSLGIDKANALPMFHALTGCDQTSFSGRSKKSAWSTWQVFEERRRRFVVLLYDRISTCSTVNETRKELFTRKGRMIDSIPPTKDALWNHLKRAVLQGAYIWSQLLNPYVDIPTAASCGWKKGDQNWEPIWTTLPPASKACQELIKCGCDMFF